MEKAVCMFCRHARPRIRPQFVPRTRITPIIRSSYATTTDIVPTNGEQFPFATHADVTNKTQKMLDENNPKALQRVRVVPTSMAYFTAKPQSTDRLLELQAVLRKCEVLPMREGPAPRILFMRLQDIRSLSGGEEVRPTEYEQFMRILKRLTMIRPDVIPHEALMKIMEYKRPFQPPLNVRRPIEVDEYGRAKGVGRRKTSSAVAWLVEGEGKVMINGRTLPEYFSRMHHRESTMWSLIQTKRTDRYNVFALVTGGGETGQAEALMMAIAKALVVHEPEMKKFARVAGCITRDPRKVERKKPGKLKARKMPAWVKR